MMVWVGGRGGALALLLWLYHGGSHKSSAPATATFHSVNIVVAAGTTCVMVQELHGCSGPDDLGCVVVSGCVAEAIPSSNACHTFFPAIRVLTSNAPPSLPPSPPPFFPLICAVLLLIACRWRLRTKSSLATSGNRTTTSARRLTPCWDSPRAWRSRLTSPTLLPPCVRVCFLPAPHSPAFPLGYPGVYRW